MGFGPFLVYKMITTIAAKLSDITIIQQLARLSWGAAYATILSKDQLEYMLEMMYSEETINGHFQNTNYHYYLILEGDNALGFVGFEHHAEDKTTKLHRIYLIPEAKGKGAGKLGLNLVKSQAEKAGDSRIILTVNKHNSAKDFYESQGYRIYDEGVFDVGDNYVMDDYLMELIF